MNFNPTTTKVVTKKTCAFFCTFFDISIHTTTKVVTFGEWVPDSWIEISIHTTTKVVTQYLKRLGRTKRISIHTTTKVVTVSDEDFSEYLGISIHTTTKVVTKQFQQKQGQISNFNPHHHEGGD